MKKTDIKSPLLLFLAAFIWGVAFVAQSKAKDYSSRSFGSSSRMSSTNSRKRLICRNLSYLE